VPTPAAAAAVVVVSVIVVVAVVATAAAAAAVVVVVALSDYKSKMSVNMTSHLVVRTSHCLFLISVICRYNPVSK